MISMAAIEETDSEIETLINDDEDKDVNEGESFPAAIDVSSDDEDNDFTLACLPDDERRARREAMRPDIDWLDDAIDWEASTPSGVDFLLKAGNYVIIERQALCLPNFGWLDTRVYLITHAPTPDGTIKLYDPVRQHQVYSNWKVGIVNNFKFKIPPRGVNPEKFLEGTGKVRRRKKIIPPSKPMDPNAPKRGRGRPKGSKNRPKEEIETEKRELREEQKHKMQARETLRRQRFLG